MRRGCSPSSRTPEAMLRAIAELRSRGTGGSTRSRRARSTASTRRWGSAARRSTGSSCPWRSRAPRAATSSSGFAMRTTTRSSWAGGRARGLAFIPITFEMMVLSAALTGFVVLLVLARLPELWHPVFDVPGFERASIDRFWVGIDARDPALIQPHHRARSHRSRRHHRGLGRKERKGALMTRARLLSLSCLAAALCLSCTPVTTADAEPGDADLLDLERMLRQRRFAPYQPTKPLRRRLGHAPPAGGRGAETDRVTGDTRAHPRSRAERTWRASRSR